MNLELSERILEILKNSLSISIEEHYVSYIGKGVKVSLQLNGETISSDHIILEND